MEHDVTRCCKVAIIVTGTIALTIAASFVFLRIHEFLGLVIEQGIEGLLDTVADKIFKIVLYEILVQLYNITRRSYCFLWQILCGNSIIPMARSYVYLLIEKSIFAWNEGKAAGRSQGGTYGKIWI